MLEKQEIIHMYRNGLSERAIARSRGVSRSTVRKVVAAYNKALQSESPGLELSELLISPTKYDSSRRTKRVLTEEVTDIIKACVRSNITKLHSGLRKQMMKNQDIHSLLVGQGYRISYSTVCNYIRYLEQARSEVNKEAFIRQYYEPGQMCEFDWGEVKLYIKGHLLKLYMAVFTFSHSNGWYAYLFRRQNSLAFMESHRDFFKAIEGVPSIMVYDNMRVAVKEFVGNEKKPTDALSQMSDYYGFTWRFCNIRAGWEKGHVERSVEYVRRRAFSREISFESMEEAGRHLATVCKMLNSERGSLSTNEKAQRLSADLMSLNPSMIPMACFEMGEYTVDKWSTVCMRGTHYSVPDTLVGAKVSVKIFSEKIMIYHNKDNVAIHERSYETGRWVINIEHYFNTFLRKPGAIKNSEALRQSSEAIRHIFRKYFSDQGRDFIILLQYAQKYRFLEEDIIQACHTLRQKGVRHISSDQIKAVMHANNDEEQQHWRQTPQDERQCQEIEQGASDLLENITFIMEN